ncbi:uncharacterized protein LOC122510543 [Leptopilina heterotoma]|uniref:uncharacterized protein LOC122498891 n=1 Tax=Leptopilina heterotoma TaxID=63436 RepID=UPI001CA7DC35|nr:uncharacterized protein LOC122498891 [Leptopilina heterotoma]XP_043481226.1 uncharacterized protein LOC122510543 [Leptopilina heterotoma]
MDTDEKSIFKRLLIKLVSKHEVLHDRESDGFINRNKKKRIWEDIASEICIYNNEEVSVSDIMSKWATLKKRFAEEQKKIREYIPSGSAAPEKLPEWEYFQDMKFLEKFSKHIPTVSNVKKDKQLEVIDESCSSGSDSEYFSGENSITENNDDDLLTSESEEGDLTQPESSTVLQHNSSITNSYMLIMRAQWKKIPEANKIIGYTNIKKMIQDKKDAR